MAARDHTAGTVVLVGGAGLLAWWLLSRGRGWGFRGSGEDHGAATTATTATPQSPSKCVVWIRANRIEVDGVVQDLATVVATCRAVGTAEVHATGDAITGSVIKVLTSLQAAGVKIQVTPDLARLVPAERAP